MTINEIASHVAAAQPPETFKITRFSHGKIITKTIRSSNIVDAKAGILSKGHVQYSRFDGAPRNTLFTIIDAQGFVYFGIARCNLKFEKSCTKREGLRLARERALIAVDVYANSTARFLIDNSGLRGKVAMEYRPHLEDIFYALDRD